MKLNAAYGGDNSDNKDKDKKKKEGDKFKDSTKTKIDKSFYRPKDQFKIIMEKKVCAKCFAPGHKPSDTDAPCKNSKMRPFEELATMSDQETTSAPSELPENA
jgi:hypothetical protein